MKILKYTGIAATILLMLFLVIGLATPSFEYATHISITAPRETCWQSVQDTTRMKSWVPGFKTLTLKSGQHNQPGAVYELVVTQDETYVMQETLRDIREPELIAFILDNDVMNLEYELLFREEGNQTIIDGHYKVAGNNIVWRSLLFLSKSYLQQSSQEQLALLKKMIERTP